MKPGAATANQIEAVVTHHEIGDYEAKEEKQLKSVLKFDAQKKGIKLDIINDDTLLDIWGS